MIWLKDITVMVFFMIEAVCVVFFFPLVKQFQINRIDWTISVLQVGNETAAL